ncbi:MAG: DMT family transporter [Bacteroidia bacterium]
MNVSKLALAHAAMFAVALFYAINYFISQFVFQSISPFALLAFRSITAIVVFVSFSLFFKVFRFPNKKDLPRLLFCALTGITINQIFFLWGLKLTLAINSAILMVCSPIFVFLIAWFVKASDEKFTPYKVIGLCLSSIGAVLLITHGKKVSFGENTVLGDIMTLINALSYSVYLVFVKPLVNKYSMFNLFAWIFIFGGSINILLGLPAVFATDWSVQAPELFLGIVYVCIFATVLAYSLNAWAMRYVPASYVGIYVYSQPALVTFFSLFLDQKAIYAEKVLYILLIFVGVFLTTNKIKLATKA